MKDIPNNLKFGDIKLSERLSVSSFAFWFAVLVLVDQLAKYLITVSHWQFFKNYNFAFSLPIPPPLMYIIYAVILGAIGYHVAKNYIYFNKVQGFAWTLIISGAISNIGERIFLGYVRDFIYILAGVFNLADGYIILGILMLLLNKPKP